MSLASDRRALLAFGLLGCAWLALGAVNVAGGASVEEWLFHVAIGAVVCVLVADGIQRRLRGDPRLHESGPDRRSLAALIVALLGLAAVGLWFYARGHARPVSAVLVWFPLSCAVLLAWARRGLPA